MAFNLRKNNQKDTTNVILYNYYRTPFYKNQYEKTPTNGGYIKLPYTSHSNTPNIILDNEYITQNIFVCKKIHTIESVDFDAELIIEHISLTNTKPLYTCILLKTANVVDTKIDHMIQMKDDLTLDLNELLFMSDCTRSIVYDSKTPIESTKIVVFTNPILVSSTFDVFSKLSLFSPHNNDYSFVRMQPILGNVVEGFKEGLETKITQVGYCQPIDENNPDIGNSAQVIIPMDSEKIANNATQSTIRTVLNFFSFIALIILVVIGLPPLYNLLIVKIVLENADFTPQSKLNRVAAIDIYMAVVLFGLSFTLINVGIVKNIPLFTSTGFYIFIFLITSFLLLQFQRGFSEDYKNKFLEQFNTPLNGGQPASFEKMQNDLVGLVIDNLSKLLVERVTDNITGKTSLVAHSGVFILPGVFLLLYFIMKYYDLTNLPSSSFLFSLPFYAFLLAVYLSILFKTYIEKPPVMPVMRTMNKNI